MEAMTPPLQGCIDIERNAQVLAALAGGEIDLVVGTHALISEDVHFARLGLAIVDEQHRCGCSCQRAITLPWRQLWLRQLGISGPCRLQQAHYGGHCMEVGCGGGAAGQ